MNNDIQITATALRWFTARQRRLAIGAEQRRFRKEFKTLTGFGGSDSEISQRHLQAKRLELAAARALAKACEQHRGQLSHADDVSPCRASVPETQVPSQPTFTKAHV